MSTYFNPIAAGYDHVTNRPHQEPTPERMRELLEFGMCSTPLAIVLRS